jgi:hypothetical protein
MKRRTIALIAVWTLPSVVLLAATAIAYSTFRIAPPERLTATERTAVMRPLRAALSGQVSSTPPAVRRALAGALAVTVWWNGKPIVRVDATGTDVATTTALAARQLRDRTEIKNLSVGDRLLTRIQVDLVTGTAPIGGGSPVFDTLAIPGIGNMLAINPGVEGVGAELDGKPVLLLPHELVAARLLTAKRPSKAIPDLAMGIDLARISELVAARGGRPKALAATTLFRFRTDTFVEPPDRESAPLPLYRGLPPPPKLSAQALRSAALDGARYLVAHLAPNGRYVYEHDLWTGRSTDAMQVGGHYSMPRHAGTTYFLAEIYRITKEPWLREPIERAFAHLAELMAQGKCAHTLPDGTAIDCVADKNDAVAHLGSTALTVVALAEYQRATGDKRYLPTATKLAAFLLWMQRPNGSFRHVYDLRTHTPDDKSELLYYSGEAALALARMHTVTGDARYATAATGALDWLVDWYDFFMAGFFYGEEHWTCIAAEAAWPAAKREKYKEFCHGYGTFLRAQQPEVGEHPDEYDYAGSYGLTPFVVPYNTPAGSRTEAMISAYLLGKHHGDPDRRIADQIRAAMQYTLGQQIRPDNNYNVVGEGVGGMPGSPIDRNIRIDYVQHVCSAMIRASEWVDIDP